MRALFRIAQQPLIPLGDLCTAEGRGRRLEEERAAVPHLHLLSSLSRRVDKVPALRDRLWSLERATIDRIWSALGDGDPEAVSDRGELLGRLIGPRIRKQRHVLRNLATAFPVGRPCGWRRRPPMSGPRLAAP